MFCNPCFSSSAPTTSVTRSDGRPAVRTGRTVSEPSGPLDFINSSRCRRSGAGLASGGAATDQQHPHSASRTTANRLLGAQIELIRVIKLFIVG